jgi:hypothetical protein
MPTADHKRPVKITETQEDWSLSPFSGAKLKNVSVSNTFEASKSDFGSSDRTIIVLRVCPLL